MASFLLPAYAIAPPLRIRTPAWVFRPSAGLQGRSCSGGGSINRGALGGVAVAEAVATDDHVVQGVVVLLRHLVAGVEHVVAQRVELDELHPELTHEALGYFTGLQAQKGFRSVVQVPSSSSCFLTSRCPTMQKRSGCFRPQVEDADSGSCLVTQL